MTLVERDDAAARRGRDRGDRPARRGASARRGRDVVGRVRLPVLAVRASCAWARSRSPRRRSAPATWRRNARRCSARCWSPPAIGLALILLQVPLGAIIYRADGRERGGDARRRDLFLRAHLVGAVRARQLRAARLVRRARARRDRARAAGRDQPGQPRRDRAAGAVVRPRRHRRGARRAGRGGDRDDRRPRARAAHRRRAHAGHWRSCSIAPGSCACSWSIATS